MLVGALMKGTVMSNRATTHAFSLTLFGDVWADLRERIALIRVRRAAYNQTWDELSCLTDRELNDIGFARHDIRRVAHEVADEAARKHARGV